MDHGNGSMNWNWGFLEPSTAALKNHFGLHLMSSIAEKALLSRATCDQNTHPSTAMASTNGGPFHHHRVGGVSGSHNIPIDCYWMNHNRDKHPNILSRNQNQGYYPLSYGISPDNNPPIPSIQLPHQIDLPKTENTIPQMEEVCEERDDGNGGNAGVLGKKRGGGKVPKCPSKEKKQRTRSPKRGAEVVINGMNMDISGIPIPVCSCTGTSQQCYRWGSGGWQSSCCTTSLSLYPLPMNAKRHGARIAGRKMSIGAFKKVLEKLASESYDFANPIDLRSYWAKHGTNKFVTIR